MLKHEGALGLLEELACVCVVVRVCVNVRRCMSACMLEHEGALGLLGELVFVYGSVHRGVCVPI